MRAEQQQQQKQQQHVSLMRPRFDPANMMVSGGSDGGVVPPSLMVRAALRDAREMHGRRAATEESYRAQAMQSQGVLAVPSTPTYGTLFANMTVRDSPTFSIHNKKEEEEEQCGLNSDYDDGDGYTTSGCDDDDDDVDVMKSSSNMNTSSDASVFTDARGRVIGANDVLVCTVTGTKIHWGTKAPRFAPAHRPHHIMVGTGVDGEPHVLHQGTSAFSSPVTYLALHPNTLCLQTAHIMDNFL